MQNGMIAGLKKPPNDFSLGGLCGSMGHLAASFGATAARLGAALAVIHILLAALFCTPVADVCAQFANLFGKRTVAGNRISAQAANCRAFDAAGRAGIFAFLADHVRETVAALCCTVVAGGDAVLGVLIQMMTHGMFPFASFSEGQKAQSPRVTLPMHCTKIPLSALFLQDDSEVSCGYSPSRSWFTDREAIYRQYV